MCPAGAHAIKIKLLKLCYLPGFCSLAMAINTLVRMLSLLTMPHCTVYLILTHPLLQYDPVLLPEKAEGER